MGIWWIVTAALVLLSTGAVWCRQRKYRERELADISAMLECILDDRELPENRSHEETIYSKIQHQLYRMQSMTKGCHARLEQDRDSIKNLITEIAHQLRTPLANIETYLDFLGDENLSRQEQKEFLQAASVSEKKIHFLTESFIKMSRLEHRIIQIRPIDTDLLLTLELAVGQAEAQAKNRGIRIRTQFPEQLAYTHDADWLGEAVYNLLDNAVKYSKMPDEPASFKTEGDVRLTGEKCPDCDPQLPERTDVTHSIEKKPDFTIAGNHFGMYTSEMEAQSSSDGDSQLNTMYDDFTPITKETRERLLSVQGVQEENTSMVRGAYLYVDAGDESMEPWEEAMGRGEENRADSQEAAGSEDAEGAESEEDEQGFPSFWGEATVHIADEELIQQLEEYVEKNHLAVDMESLRDGTGTIFLHYHAFSPSIQEEADQKQGLPVTFWRLPSREERTTAWENMDRDSFENWRQEKGQMMEMKLAGYLDIKSKGFPDFRRERNGSLMYFLVSEKGFEKLGTEEKTFVMEMNVEREQEPAAKAAVRKILQEENHRDVCLGLYVQCKSDELADAQEYIRTNRILLWALSLVLILMGLLNYLNVIATGILSVIFAACVSMPLLMYGRMEKRSVTQRTAEE